MSESSLTSVIESALFTHGEPLSIQKLAKASASTPARVREALDELASRYADAGSGLTLIRTGDLVEVATKPDNAAAVESLLASENDSPLGRASLEVLAIVCYRGSVSRAAIDAIRGVNSSFSLRTLLLRGLIDRVPNPLDAREYLYAPTFKFLETIGISEIGELPGYESLSRDPRLNPSPEADVAETVAVDDATDAEKENRL